MENIGRSSEIAFATTSDRELFEMAPPEWRQKAQTMVFERDRQLELVAGGLLVRMLAKHGVVRPKFVFGPYGKPGLADGSGLHFSISHSGSVVMVVISDCPVGCDLERIVLEPGRDREFYELWTRREAGLKMRGSGFATGVAPDAAPDPLARNVPAPAGYIAAICPIVI